jgi:hypothetical protein
MELVNSVIIDSPRDTPRESPYSRHEAETGDVDDEPDLLPNEETVHTGPEVIVNPDPNPNQGWRLVGNLFEAQGGFNQDHI